MSHVIDTDLVLDAVGEPNRRWAVEQKVGIEADDDVGPAQVVVGIDDATKGVLTRSARVVSTLYPVKHRLVGGWCLWQCCLLLCPETR